MIVTANTPFAITLFTQTAWVDTQFSAHNSCAIPCPALGSYLNVSQLQISDNHIRFLCSVVVKIVPGKSSRPVLDFTGKMSGPNNDSGTLVLHGLTVNTQRVAPDSCTADFTLASQRFAVDGWHSTISVTQGIPVLHSEGWFTSPLRQVFEVACLRATKLHAASFKLNAAPPTAICASDLLAVALQAGAGPYTHQTGGDWRGCGLSAKCTNQDCDGMAMNVLVFFSALRRQASAWSFAAASAAETARIELLNYCTPVFFMGLSARPSSLVPTNNKHPRPVYRRPNKKWPIGHAWAGITNQNNTRFIHIECTTPGASTPEGGMDEKQYRAQIEAAGGIEEVDGSHGEVSAVGVRQHHAASYKPVAAYTPTAMYTATGVHDVCGAALSGIEKYYGVAFKKKQHPNYCSSNGAKYEFGAHRPNTGGAACSYPVNVDSPYLDTPSLDGKHGVHAFARFSVGALTM